MARRRVVRDAKAAVAEARRALAAALRRWRAMRGVTQVRLAASLGSSQSRVAKMEAADPTVSLELLMRALVVLGATRSDVGRELGVEGPIRIVARRRRRTPGSERSG